MLHYKHLKRQTGAYVYTKRTWKASPPDLRGPQVGITDMEYRNTFWVYSV